MLTQYFFRNNIHDKISPFKRKSSWTPRSSDNPTLTNFFTRTEQDLISVTTPGGKTYSNLTLQEKSALNNLKKNQSIALKPCDKGGGNCIMNTIDYLTKIHAHLQDDNTYKPLTYNPTSAIINDACTLIEYIRRRHSSRDSLHGRIQAPTTHKLPTTPYSAHNTRFHPQT